MKNVPKKIYLQVGDATDWNELDEVEVSWCTDRVNDSDIEFLLPEPNNEGDWISVKRAEKYAKMQHFRGTQDSEFIEFEDWKYKPEPNNEGKEPSKFKAHYKAVLGYVKVGGVGEDVTQWQAQTLPPKNQKK